MGPTPSRTFRGSAAFFAMLLAASSGAAGEFPAPDARPADQTRPASPQAFRGRGPGVVSASKFTRRRLPLARRMTETAQPG